MIFRRPSGGPAWRPSGTRDRGLLPTVRGGGDWSRVRYQHSATSGAQLLASLLFTATTRYSASTGLVTIRFCV